jgi:hypothetical protein
MDSIDPAVLRRRAMTGHLLGLRVRIPPWAWMFVYCECCVFLLVHVSATGRSLVQGNPTKCVCENGNGAAVYFVFVITSRSAADRLLGLRVRIQPGAWMVVRCECCLLSGRCMFDGLIPRLEESYRRRCVIVCDLESSRIRRSWPSLGCCAS